MATETFKTTLNPDYDQTRRNWAATGHDSDPSCENCGADTEGRAVHETSVSWVCDGCLPEAIESDREYQANSAAERRMGY